MSESGDTSLATVLPRPASEDRFTPRNVQDALALGQIVHKSRLYPVQSPEAATMMIMMAVELEISPLQALRGMHLIEGKPSLSADMMLALCKRKTEICEYFRLVKSTMTEATYTTKRRGEETPTTLSWTIEQARQAGLAGRGTWQKHPDAMLRARCIAALARAVYPDLLLGVYEEDEGREIQERQAKAPVAEILPPAPNLMEGTDEITIKRYCQEIEEAATWEILRQVVECLNREPKEIKKSEVLREAVAARKEALAPKEETPKPPLALTSPNPDSAKIPAQAMGPGDYDQAEAKAPAPKWTAREAITEAQAKAKSQAQPKAENFTKEEQDLLRAVEHATMHTEIDRYVARVETERSISPVAAKVIESAAKKRHEALTLKESNAQPQLYDPKM